MTPERDTQIKENIFDMWFELIRRGCEMQCSPDLGGTPEQLNSEYDVLDASKEVLRENFIKHYRLNDFTVERDDENLRLLKEL